ncbi:MAG: hypothetical protein GY931_13985 [Maribacter sp.]|nr:hypothetical protein [Maribacter sp.]
MNYLKIFFTTILIFFLSISSYAQGPNDEVWALFAAGVGQKLEPGMDPCWITYTVALETNPRIAANVEMGTMGIIVSGVTWWEATAQQRRFSRYFDDEPDGTFKLTPCEINWVGGIWNGWGTMTISGSGTSVRGTYSDTYEKPKKGKITIYRENGKLVGTWEEPGIGRKGTLYNISVSKNGKSISGKYDTTVDGGKGNWHKNKPFTWTYRSPSVKH